MLHLPGEAGNVLHILSNAFVYAFFVFFCGHSFAASRLKSGKRETEPSVTARASLLFRFSLSAFSFSPSIHHHHPILVLRAGQLELERISLLPAHEL